MAPLTKLYIDGKFVPSSTGETFEVRNPHSGQVVGISSSASSADCKAAVHAAAKAFKAWEHSNLNDRRDVLLRAADLLASEEYRTKVLEAITEETAGASYWGTFNVMGSINFLRSQAGTVEKLKGEIFPSGTVPGAQAISQRRAMGVIFGIAPWNAPVTLSIRAVAVPILCGNTTILKSSESSPRSQSIVAELFHEAGLPAGVLNFISMSRESAPALTAEIIAHPLVRSINFTGSDRVGKIIAMEAAQHLKPCVLELGGKSPSLVLDDANVAEAAKGIAFGAMAHSGQICMSTERVIVQRGIAEQLMSEIKELCGSLKVGDVANDHSVSLGALFTESSADNIVGMIKEAQASGAELILGDTARQRSLLVPHMLKGVKPGMRVWDRESFGPVIVFAVVESIDEAVDMANASEYSLAASLWTSDLYGAQSIASRIRAGCTNINGPTIHSEPSDGLLGLGGSSGYGRFHIENFTDKRVIVTHPLGRKYPPPFFS
ncbi:Aldehyde/histidinol dehydrogenase [Flammula alnicola]|nr:Aldehyde/histidinol dehydrogenase [Flammula alnicola]